ncbi:S8 family serine peptidase [Saprospiraceae bacterium]|nr:S8 family serine peptidase [bacterium]MDB4768568.1 S8 family serine peptidase [Saprospiraceae bacterium]
MLSILYPISFSISLFGLILWFYNEGNPLHRRNMSTIFLGGFVAYAFSLAFADGELAFKMWILFRDLMVLGTVSTLFSFFRNSKFFFFGMFVLLIATFPFTFLKKMNNTFPQKSVTNVNKTIQSPQRALVEDNSNFVVNNLDQEGELLVDLGEKKTMRDLERIVSKYKLTFKKAFAPDDDLITDLDDYMIVNIPFNYEKDIDEIEKELLASGSVDYLEQNEIVQLTPIETIRPSKRKRAFGINDPGVQELWGFDKLRMDDLYKLLKSRKVKPQRKANIFILDTGVDSDHEDLKSNYQSYKKEYDSDRQGHGTHCAGIAAAVTNNKLGVASYAPNNDFVKVTSIKVLTDYGGGTQKSVISGMLEAADNGADVISMSLGALSNKNRKRAYARAVDYCNRKGAIVIAAAGNNNMDAAKYSPANAPGIIAVSAIDTNLQRAHFSNYVQNVPFGIAAPGVNIYSTFPKNQYKTFNGTSMACPYVAGLVGLMKSINPEIITKEVFEILEKTGKETKSTSQTGKLIQPASAIAELLK